MQRKKRCGGVGDEGMNKPSREVHKIYIEGDQFVVHSQEGQRLFAGSYQEVEVWLDHRENVVQPRVAGRRRGMLLQSILKAVRRAP